MSEAKTSILGHLRELRNRLINSVIAIAVGTGVAFWKYSWLIDKLQSPAPENVKFIYTKAAEGFSVSMRVSFIAGIVIAMPVIMYNLFMFILPALHTREKRVVLLILPWVLLMFFGGVLFGYYVLLPPALNFLLNFGADVAEYMLTLGEYVGFVTRLLLIVGLAFELPVVTTFLVRIGVVSHRWLANKRKIVIILSFVASAAITPTPDAFNQSIVAATLIVLYELSIWLAWLMEKRKKVAEST
ncbi:MAG: twin-arginine translocase subunit TatC [Dehalococcoidia bacterium]|nr:twin-arginine translocase subunit TatC [Dehalococcoidia bacterium]